MNNKCPFCGEEMTAGVIQSRDGVYWSRKASPMAALSWLNKDAITLADSGSSVFGGAAAEAFNCPRPMGAGLFRRIRLGQELKRLCASSGL